MSTAFVEAFNRLQAEVHATANDKGWWEKRDGLEDACAHIEKRVCETPLTDFAETTNQLSCLMLVVSELSEAVEAIRHGNPPDDKIPNFSGAEAECADAIIRLMDLAERSNWNLAEAIVEKTEMNKWRPHMHGGKKA